MGKNLVTRLEEIDDFTVLPFVREDDAASLIDLVAQVDTVVHLAGENRPKDNAGFVEGNTLLTQVLCDAIRAEFVKNGRKIRLIFASSTQAALDNPYGASKQAAEVLVQDLASDMGDAALIFRFPGVFG
jgi:UDP-2-acetamido-2,6-beta-L-arabino-hexul-4-ose reductase